MKFKLGDKVRVTAKGYKGIAFVSALYDQERCPGGVVLDRYLPESIGNMGGFRSWNVQELEHADAN